MSYKHLTISERASIEVLLKENYSIRKIASVLNRLVSTISREIKRNKSNDKYFAESAHSEYNIRKKCCGRKCKLTSSLAEKIINYLKRHWLPEQIVGRLFNGELSFKYIYRWINNNLLCFLVLPYLRHKDKRQKRL